MQIQLHNGLTAEIDDEDFEAVHSVEFSDGVSVRAVIADWKWFALKNTRYGHYAVAVDRSTDKKRTMYLHRLVMNATRGSYVDHIDCDGLNCRKTNLRPATARTNMGNKRKLICGSSQYKGVSFSRNRFVACIWPDGKTKYLGKFVDEIEAAKAYDVAALEYFGEFARTNFPRENYTSVSAA